MMLTDLVTKLGKFIKNIFKGFNLVSQHSTIRKRHFLSRLLCTVSYPFKILLSVRCWIPASISSWNKDMSHLGEPKCSFKNNLNSRAYVSSYIALTTSLVCSAECGASVGATHRLLGCMERPVRFSDSWLGFGAVLYLVQFLFLLWDIRGSFLEFVYHPSFQGWNPIRFLVLSFRCFGWRRTVPCRPPSQAREQNLTAFSQAWNDYLLMCVIWGHGNISHMQVD